MFYSIWGNSEKQYDEAYKHLDDFFESLHDKTFDNTSGVKVAYREEQGTFALTVMESIKDKKILLIQAGVGTGKSFGYLIPVFYTFKDVTYFDKVIISTSSIALQEQLLGDVEKVSKLLNYNIKSWLSKGINNYACLKRIDKKMESASEHADEKTVKTLQDMKRAMIKEHTCDKAHLPSITSNLWDEIRVCGGCDRCKLKNKCTFIEGQAHIQNMPIVITNHTQLTNMIKQKATEFTSSSLVIIDEAHKLEEEMRLASQSTLNIDEVKKTLNSILILMENDDKHDYYYEIEEYTGIMKIAKGNLYELAKALRSNARTTFSRQENSSKFSIENCDKLRFNIANTRIQAALFSLCSSLQDIKQVFAKVKLSSPIETQYRNLLQFLNIFKDMTNKENSSNLYWVRFCSEEKIELVYTTKDLSTYYKTLFESGKPIVLTSATMTTEGKYDHMIDSLNLQKNKEVVTEYPIDSPFDYGANSLFYYDTEAVSPITKNHDEYIADIAERISDLIDLTNGKALVLFTSKVDMLNIYKVVKEINPRHNLICQSGNDTEECKKQFTSEINSSLFATGAFWEGVDFPGKTLSNLIIVKLPFPVQDPIVDYKRNSFPKEKAFNVDLNEMLMKLSQGTGRLIRSSKDTGIICCLDSRVPKYMSPIKKSLPFTNYTSDKNKLERFARKKITKEQAKVLKLEPIK